MQTLGCLGRTVAPPRPVALACAGQPRALLTSRLSSSSTFSTGTYLAGSIQKQCSLALLYTVQPTITSCHHHQSNPTGSTPLVSHMSSPRRAQRCRRSSQIAAKIKDPDLDDEAAAIKGPPPLQWRVLAALTYLIPWIDVISLGREIYHIFPSFLWMYFFPGVCLRGWMLYPHTHITVPTYITVPTHPHPPP